NTHCHFLSPRIPILCYLRSFPTRRSSDLFSLKENGPLWRVECNWSDPRLDPFDDENFRIILNENHPDYKLTGSGDKVGLSPLMRSEEHTSELQSRENLVCRLLLEKKKKTY